MTKSLMMLGLRGFASAFSVQFGGIEVAVKRETATGDLSLDVTELLVAVGEAATQRSSPVVILIDEVQYLSGDELSAIMVALHRVSQKQLPLLLFGAGLPQLAALAGEAKSYAERLFFFNEIGQLSNEAARTAIVEPLKVEGRHDEDSNARVSIPPGLQDGVGGVVAEYRWPTVRPVPYPGGPEPRTRPLPYSIRDISSAIFVSTGLPAPS